jgi:uncharacterized protein YbjT (DUF2867 family)
MILVVGATGRLGGTIAQTLLAQGQAVRVLLRHNSPSAELSKQGLATSADVLMAAGVQPVYGDLKDRASLDAACQGVEAVITTANSARRGGEDNVDSVDAAGNRSLIDAAQAANVKQFIFVSALGAAPDSPVPFLAAKSRTEDYLRDSGLTHTILASTAFMESWPVRVVGLPAMTGQPVTLLGEARSRQSFISIVDVAAYAVAAVGHPAAKNQTLAIGGPEALSYRDVVGVYEQVLGRTIPVNFVAAGEPVPGLPPSMSAMWASLDFDIIVDSSELAQTFGIRQTSLEEVAQRMVANAHAPGYL